MRPRPIITLTTDFGTRDTYVGQVKGAVLSVMPDVRMVDLCHDVPPLDVAAGGFVLETAYAAFPVGTIHVAVVDPGVGTNRRAIVAQTAHYFFVAPDNGLLSRVLRREPALRIHALENPRYAGPIRSATFDGRDLFAPAAAWLASGVAVGAFGSPVDDPVLLPPSPTGLSAGKGNPVNVLAVDVFGNATLDVTLEALTAVLGAPPDPRSPLRVETPSGPVRHFRRTYADAGGLGPFLLMGSSGYLEIAWQGGRAAERLGLRPGLEVTLFVA